MSVYKEIKTEYKTAQSLVKALKDLGLEIEASTDLRANNLNIRDYHGNQRGVAIAVDFTSFSAKVGGRAWGSIGFAWNAQSRSYDLVVDSMDEGLNLKVKHTLSEIKQRYTYHEVKRQAWTKGYTVQEQRASDGTIRLQLHSVR